MRPRVALLVIGDGRDDLREAMLASFYNNARELEVVTVIEVDDRKHELGFCGAIRSGWERLRAVSSETPFDYVWHAEEDFEYLQAFDVARMAAILESDHTLAQVALKRGPYGSEPAGGFMAAWPDHWQDKALRVDLGGLTREYPYCVQATFFTTNPSLYARELIEDYDWPEAPACEAEFARRLIAHERRFAYWGCTTDAPVVKHTGLTRTGSGY